MLSSLRLTKVADNLYEMATLAVRTTRDTWISWKCVDKNCRATMCTRDDVPTKLGNAHNYLPDRDAVEGRTILCAIRFRAKTELTPI